LEEKAEELKKAQEELEKKKKKMKNNKAVQEEQIDAAPYKYLPKEILMKLLEARVSGEDCNAGCIFDNLTSEYWPDSKFAIELICDVLPTQNVQLLIFHIQKEGEEDGALEVCTNYRYVRRKEEKAKQGEKKDDTTLKQGEQGETKKKKKAPVVKGVRGKRDGKDEVPQKSPEEEEKERKKKEEEERRRMEEEMRADLRPKEYTTEELEKYQKFVEEINEVFANINIRQMNVDETEDEAKAEGAEGEEEEKKGDEEEEPQKKTVFGKRMVTEQPIHYDFKFLCEDVKKQVPEPMWPDPDKEPLPPPEIHQIVKRPPNRPDRSPITLYSIWTPIPPEEEGGETKFTNQQTRWVLQPKESRKLHIRFCSKATGTYEQTMQFEIVGSYKTMSLNLSAVCDFPTINNNPKNVFMNTRRNRPAQPPDSYIQKCYINSEQTFDFGPLLVGKDPEKRSSDPQMKKMNSWELQITNNGKFQANATFTLKSTLPVEEGGKGEKSPFILDPENMVLEKEETKKLTVWCFPDKPQVFKDDLICLIQDNPNPYTFSLACLGAKPIV